MSPEQAAKVIPKRIPDEARCEFCYLVNPDFGNENNDALDLHYINKCVMLTTC
jgi:hypothetical protein